MLGLVQLEEALVTLQNSVPQAGDLDTSLRCDICKDWYTGPVSLSCGHAFCSACIRQNLDYKVSTNSAPLCPACRSSVKQEDLRPVVALRDVVAAYKALLFPLQQQLAPPVPPAAVAPTLPPSSDNKPSSRKRASPHSKAAGAAAAPGSRRAAHSNIAQANQGSTIVIDHDSEKHGGAECLGEQQGEAAEVDETDSVCQLSDEEEESSTSSQGDEDFRLSQEDEEHWPKAPPPKRTKQQPNQPLSNQWHQQRHKQQQQQPKTVMACLDGKGGARVRTSQMATPAAVDASKRVACPVCSAWIREEYINNHLDACITKSSNQQQQQMPRVPLCKPSPPSKPRAPPNGPAAPSTQAQPGIGSGQRGNFTSRASNGQQQQQQQPRKPSSKVEVPAKLVLHMMKDKELKAKLQQLGLPTDGQRKDLEERYSSYRRFIQAKLDEGSRLTQGELRIAFLRQQKHLASALRSAAAPITNTLTSLAAGNAGTVGGVAPSASSHASLIADTKRRMNEQRRLEQQQQQQQQQRQGAIEQQKEGQDQQNLARGFAQDLQQQGLQHERDQHCHEQDEQLGLQGGCDGLDQDWAKEEGIECVKASDDDSVDLQQQQQQHRHPSLLHQHRHEHKVLCQRPHQQQECHSIPQYHGVQQEQHQCQEGLLMDHYQGEQQKEEQELEYQFGREEQWHVQKHHQQSSSLKASQTTPLEHHVHQPGFATAPLQTITNSGLKLQ